ncbi:MAG: M14 family metallopeptidase [Candidatus Latescibacterota bacterium]
MKKTATLPELPFEAFFTYEQVTQFVQALTDARGDLCTLDSLGRSREGRELHLLTLTDLTTGAPQDKPGYLIHGNIHAAELSGTHAALYTARQLLDDHGHSDLLRKVTFYVAPRLNPDGAQFVATTSGRIRSRTDRTLSEPNTLYQKDMDGDGLILSMRQQHPDGPFVVDPGDERLLIRRKRDARGPFCRLLPEGEIHDWDGTDHLLIEGRSLDWNWNWSYDWRPEPEQPGAGDFPFSEPEMHLFAQFIHAHPNLFAVLGYHTGPSAVLRPPSTGSDDDLDEEDIRIMEDLARIGAGHTGFPVIPVVKYHPDRSRDINLRGHFHNFGYHHLGLFAFEFELGVMENSAGISTQEQFSAETEEAREEIRRKLMTWWDTQATRDPIYRPWTPFSHPQLGPVEIGGFLLRHMAGPTLPDLARISKGTYQFTLEHARRHPKVDIEEVEAQAVGGSVFRVRCRIANRGAFPTHISKKGATLRSLAPVRVEFHPSPGAALLSEKGHQNLGHLGKLTDSRILEWFVRAEGKAETLCTIRVLGGTGGNTVHRVKVPSDDLG